MGNQQTITDAALNKIQELEKEVLVLRQCLYGVAGLSLPKLRDIEFDYKYIALHALQSKQMKPLFKKYVKDVKERVQQIFLISYQYDVKHNCLYLEEYLAD